MIRSLKIKNYILIENLDIDFNKGFSTITGETGAGKSILLGAISLILGSRVDVSLILNKEKKCVIEGEFEIKDYKLKEFFIENDLDYEEVSFLRREINSNGKSRAFVNDTPVNLNVMRDLGLKLVDIHSQHQNLNLKDNLYQLKVIDAYTNNNDRVESYKDIYKDFLEKDKEYQQLKAAIDQNRSDQDYYRFQYDQLEEANLKENEQEELESELEVLNNAESILEALENATSGLTDSETNVLDVLQEIKNQLIRNSDYLPKIQEFVDRIESSILELKDIAEEADNVKSSVEYDPARIQFLNERLDTIFSLQSKHRVDSVTELLELKDKFEQKLVDLDQSDAKIDKLKSELDKKRSELNVLADKIHDVRAKGIKSIESNITELLLKLAIPKSKFNIDLQKEGEFNEYGRNKARFLFSANTNVEAQEVSKIASGGEIARLMLSIKSIQSRSTEMPTIIFDEIDTGVSGEIGEMMGSIMKELADNNQVIAITHLPQIAALGNHHYKVYKEEVDENTATNIKYLDQSERVEEIAKMLSGKELTDAAVDNAKELLTIKN